MINIAIETACKAHIHQVDKSGKDYILHPIHVMMEMDTEEEQVVAVLNDVIEDNKDYTPEVLREIGIDAILVSYLMMLTRRDNEKYFDYINRIWRYNVDIITKVKIADLKHNMDATRLEKLTNTDLQRIKKYRKALAILEK